MGVLARIVADMRAHHPDHVAVTGDISNLGLPAEFLLAHDWLETLGDAKEVSFVPGNHDAYVRGSMPDLARVFAPWTMSDLPAADPYPYLRVRGEIALIGLSSGVPTAFFIASGRLGKQQLESTEDLLADMGRRGLVRVLMIHHPPHSMPSHLGRGLTDARDLESMIKRTGAELIIHGHDHRLGIIHLKGPKGAVPVVGVPSASAIRGTLHHRAAYHLFRISGTCGHCQIEARARGLLPGTMVVGDLGTIPI
jgi:3',5'-cyclic AMP phosphodiesterase CpdA